DRRAQRLEGGRRLAGAGRRRGEAVLDVLVLRVDLRRLVQVFEGLLELALVVQEHPVREQVLEGLGPEARFPLQGPLAQRAIGARPLEQVTLAGMRGDELVEELPRFFVVALAQRLDGLLEELDGLAGTAMRDRRLLDSHSPAHSLKGCCRDRTAYSSVRRRREQERGGAAAPREADGPC